ncbi:MAG: Glutamate synthase [NADPH] large chain [uncultured Acidimicrobiales bacterium]|uniref:Glutamate synthase [NADPH] large chain n=1 Tax=uncultured Acidimicrobiales bacterium TaxID=310071 RepID=A0A6J4HH35_9ACTN|nr:MAG: Glutamate synthase [NADPH] large chain [uncultured Acidimicrobiales bacterium]
MPATPSSSAAHRPRPAADDGACGIGFVADAQGRASRQIVEAALEGLACVKHRGAAAADGRTGDGAGVLLPIPPALFGAGNGVATLFVRGDDPRTAVEVAAKEEGLEVVDWRQVPTDDAFLGSQALASKPQLLQAVLSGGDGDERKAFRLRRRIEASTEDVYVVSCSFRTVVYKGLAAADAVKDFYLDLQDDRFEAPFAVFHQRFSTNTAPTWERAQPFRMLCHNGEINAIQGNENRMRARAVLGTEAVGLGPEALFRPLLHPADSDSGKLDAAVELLTRGGRDIRHAVAMLVPEAWENDRDLDPDVRGFYRYHSALMEPWDGPAGIIFTDGLGVGAALDRNGLRPLRYAVCEDGFVTVCSEVGAVDTTGHGAVTRGRLRPGQMLFVDPTKGVLHDHELKERIAAGSYARWAADGLCDISRGEPVVVTPDPAELERRQATHGYTKEDLSMVLKPMAGDAHEPVFSMGDDSPLPHLAGRPRPVHHYLRQRFAQVTNPPIDPVRERRVMSLRTLLGPRQPILTEGPEAARLLTMYSFFMYPSGVETLFEGTACTFEAAPLDTTFAAADGPAGLRRAVERLCDDAEAAVRAGTGVLVLAPREVSADRIPVPSLLACGAVHHRLVAAELRSLTSIVVVSDSARDTHEFAAHLGYGADAVCPRLALESVALEADNDEGDVVSYEAQSRFQSAIEEGVLKILSKMGIATVDSYRGAQIFEIVGLGAEVVDLCFTGTPSVVGGIGWEALGEDALSRHQVAWPPASETRVSLDSPGFFRVRKGGEYHGKGKEVVDALAPFAVREAPAGGDGADTMMTAAHLLQRAIKGDATPTYEAYVELVNSRPPTELHDLLELVPAPGGPVPLHEVEPAADIVRRFSTGAMSHGSLSKEAHETLSAAMNLLGGRSNCGEGGEDPARFRTRGQASGDTNSKIKQIASGRFGVTPEYTAHADELQIKVAQGAKPGEGGQLPGHKVSEEIARLRHTQPGIALISPPPHHDIYSIEDLAQLIFDLKQVNGAEVSVKLVAEDGVGTVAAGVVKALADVVHISGATGGTGAAALSSIKHAGMPWELGLAETQHALVDSHLRSRVRVRVDGGFLTGRQVIVAALLGADEYSFGTAAMIAEGCIMLRACHRDTCKPGIATQRPNLRANFTGTPEGVAAFMLFVAEEVRGHLAGLGFRSLDDAIGQVSCLRQVATGDPRADAVDLGQLLVEPGPAEEPRHFVRSEPIQSPRSKLGDQLLADAFRDVWDGQVVELAYAITNADRTVGAALGGAIALEYGTSSPRGTARVRFDGSAGQSFGAFLTAGAELHLVGEANDYVGKGMGGGRVVITPPADDAGQPVLAGNTCLYGATGGELFVAGEAGERFAVRNSGATAVVEGAGDHCCEYMTGGTVVVLGPVGNNFGAGMTGGQAYVLDPQHDLMGRLNTALVEAARPDNESLDELRWLLERHVELTGSARGAEALASWTVAAELFWHVLPIERVRRIEATSAGRVSGPG